MSSDDLFDDPAPGPLEAGLSPASLGSTPIDPSGVVGTSSTTNLTTSAQGTSSLHTCEECGKILKSKSGFTRHVVLHKLNHYNLRKPLEESILKSLPDVLKKVLHFIQEEPAVSHLGTEKRLFIEGLLSAVEINSGGISSLQNAISEPIIKFVLVKTKVMPSSQYEAALKNVNILLADSNYCDDIKSKMLMCVSENFKQASDRVLNRLVWRMTTQFLYEIQVLVFRAMKEKNNALYSEFSMSDKELQTFKTDIGRMLRSFYQFGLRSNNTVWSLRCKSLQERFVQSSGRSITNDDFLNSKLWEEGSVTLSDTALNLFLGIEKIIQSFERAGTMCTAAIIFESVTNAENLLILNNLRDLSRGILSEDIALDCLQDLIKTFNVLSWRKQAQKKVDMARKRQKTSDVSLRTNLKRNPVAAVSSQSSSVSRGGPITESSQQGARSVSGPSHESASASQSSRAPRKRQSTSTSQQHVTEPSVPGPSEVSSSVVQSNRAPRKKKSSAASQQDKPSGPGPSRAAAGPSSSTRSSRKKESTSSQQALTSDPEPHVSRRTRASSGKRSNK